VIEPGIQLVIKSLQNNRNLSEELLEFLFLYAKEFDPSPVRQKAIQASMKDCFDDLKYYGVCK
jgi:hypothetical protein